MKMKISILLVLFSVFLTNIVNAQAPEDLRFGMEIGYRTFSMRHHVSVHDTHTDDSFLCEAKVPGSAGTTTVGGQEHYFAIGPNLIVPLSQKFTLDFELNALIGGDTDRRQNANDMRPADKAAFVYSSAMWGIWVGTGVSYYLTPQFYVGVEGGVASMFVESGWDRYNKQETDKTGVEFVPLFGPKAGYHFSKNIAVEAAVHGGKHGVGAKTMLTFLF